MTYEEAVQKAYTAMTNSTSRSAGLVDALVALGVLDFDREEPSFEAQIDAAAKALGRDPGSTSSFLACIQYAGLKLVKI
jgi:hypothetical protein